ncbi:flagellar protein [Alkalihalobacillus sp. NPDC078783]
MSILTQLFKQTAELQKHVDSGLPPGDDERMAFIQQLDEGLIERGKLIEQLAEAKEDPSKDELRDKVIKQNTTFQANLLLLQQHIRNDLNQLHRKKETGRKYEQPYEGMTDGAFFDKRGV